MGLSALAGSTVGGLSRAAAQAAAVPSQLAVAVIGDGRTGVFASLRAGVAGAAEPAVASKLVWKTDFTASLPILEAIRAGGVDFTFATATALVNAIAAGVAIVPLATHSLPADEVDVLVQAGSPIRSAADLKGKTVAHQNGTTGTYSLIKYLDSAGLRLGDVNAVNLDGAAAAEAFDQGRIDAWIHWQPASALALAKLGARARTLPGVKTYDHAFYVARAEVAQAYPQAVARLVRMVRDSQRYIAAHPSETVAAWAALGGFAANSTDERVYRQLIVDARLSDSGAVALKPIDEAATASTQDLADNFHALGVLPGKVDVRGFLLSPAFDGIKKIVAAELGT